MGRPKALKPILIGCACLVPVGLVVGLSVNWNHTTFIAAAGSTGARGLVYGFGKEYTKEHNQIEINAESGGAATGIGNVANKLIDIGNSTSNPYYFVNELLDVHDKWANMKTVTLAWECIALIYKMPAGLSDNAIEHFDISINEQNINYLYAVFSGFNELKNDSWEAIDGTYWSFLTDEAKTEISKNESDKTICQTSQIIPYVKSGGDRSAGSCIAFSELSNLGADMTDRQHNAFLGGQYGHDRNYYETEESNAQSWKMFASNDFPCQMMYVTTSFLNESNMKLINDAGYKIAKYKGHEYDLHNFRSGYNWIRPINSSFDLNNNLAHDFMKWIFYRDGEELSEEYKNFVLSHYMMPLDENQFQTMIVGDSFEVTDFDLAESWLDEIYGARMLL